MGFIDFLVSNFNDFLSYTGFANATTPNIIMIVVGAMLWWLAITYAVDKVRSQFNKRSMWTINRVMGSILLLVALYGLGTGLWDIIQNL